MTKIIPLTQNQVALVDDEDYDFLMQWKWYAGWSKHVNSFYVMNKRMGLIHRLIMKTPKGLQVDHINHDTLDNRKENLRNVTQSQNVINTGFQKNNTTGRKGVMVAKNKYQAQIRRNGKTMYLGIFDTVEEAGLAYDIASKNFELTNSLDT